MKQKRNLWIGGTFLVVLGALGVAQSSLQKAVAAQASSQVMAPRFEVDPMWPKPLPNNMYQGQTIGVWVDKQDHVWIIHRADSLDAAEGAAGQNPPTGECCKMAPPILSSTRPATCCGRGADRMAPATSGPAPITGFTSRLMAPCGSAATAPKKDTC